MGITVTGQLLDFLLSILLGAALGAVYDLFRIGRVLHKKGAVALAAEDAFFFLFCAAVTFLFLLADDSGIVRFFLLLGEGIGATLYYFTLGAALLRAAKRVLPPAQAKARRALSRASRSVAGHVAAPAGKAVRRAAAGLRRGAGAVGGAAGGFAKKGWKCLKFRLQHPKRMMYNQRQSKGGRKPAPKRPGTGEKRRMRHEGKSEKEA